MGFELAQRYVVIGLLGQKNDNIINSIHLIGGDSGHRHILQVHFACDGSPGPVQGFHVGLIGVNEGDLPSVLRNKGAHNSSQGAGSH
ncbi:hypothetical protein SDC9_110050 [bioreactor metagenome]|uniref:Uncharacterized protein n=1 Tax=bioreactor metagenome TaxID=1076179 RepID=A0A645BCI0_9ZZZZ